MKNTLILVSLLIVLTSINANASDYYFCDCQYGASKQCVAGNNLNNGLSPSSPKQTFSKANAVFNKFNAGDSIKFCRGGAFSTNKKHRWVNNKCSASETCAVTDYETAYNIQDTFQAALPIITQTAAKSLFALEDGGNADHDEGYSFSNLDLRCTACSTGGAGFFLYNDVDHITISDIKIDGFDLGIYLAGSNTPNPGSDGTLDHINLKELRIINSRRQGILGGANNLVITNSYFENNGRGNIYDHNIYISKGNNIVIKGNNLYQSSLDSEGNCRGVSLVAHGNINNLFIEDNVVREDIGKAKASCWGIAVDTGYSKPESFTNIAIKDNKVINVGNVAIGIAACDTCVIENNNIYQQQSFKSTAIMAPNRARGDNDQPLNKVMVKNNTIYMRSPGTGIILGGEGTEHVVTGNTIQHARGNKFTCLKLNLKATAYTAVDNNTCFIPEIWPLLNNITGSVK